MSTLSYLDSSRDPQSNDTATVQSSFFYASLAIVLTKLENFSDTASTSWCQHISYVSAQQVLFRICNSGSHYYKNIKILLKIASERRFLRYYTQHVRVLNFYKNVDWSFAFILKTGERVP